MRMLAPAQNTRSLPELSTTTFTSRVLEAQPLHGVGKLDVDAEIVGIELELVAFEQPGVLVDVHDEVGDLAVECQLPVAIARGLGLEIDALGQRALSRVVFIACMHNNAYHGKWQAGNIPAAIPSWPSSSRPSTSRRFNKFLIA